MKIYAKIKGYLILAQVVLFLAIYVILVKFGHKRVYRLRKWISRVLLKINGITLNVVGDVDLNANMIICNHQSMLDIMILEYIHNKKISWVAKKELFDISFYGHVLMPARDIPVDREDKKGLLKLIKQVDNRIKKGLTVAIFPEGTRSTKGKLLRFKPGTEFVANQLGLIVQPVVIANTKKLFNTKEMELYSGEVTITLLPSFSAKDKEDSKWLNSLREEMIEVYEHRT